MPSGRPDWKRYGDNPGLPPWCFTHFIPAQVLETQRRFLRYFYLRPSFVVRQLAGVRSAAYLSALVTAGMDVRSFPAGDER